MRRPSQYSELRASLSYMKTHQETKSFSRNRKLTFGCSGSVLASEPFISFGVYRSSPLELTQGKQEAEATAALFLA